MGGRTGEEEEDVDGAALAAALTAIIPGMRGPRTRARGEGRGQGEGEEEGAGRPPPQEDRGRERRRGMEDLPPRRTGGPSPLEGDGGVILAA